MSETTMDVHSEAEVPIEQITIGRRHRRDLGDLDSLADSIRAVGLLHPVVVAPDGTLIAGLRRLEACRKLGMAKVPARVVDTADLFRAERDENAVRKDFTPSEAVAIGVIMEEREREAAKERMVIAHSSGNLPEQEQGETRERVGKALGMSGRTYEKAKEVVEAAEEDPDTYGDLQEKMDRTGSVHPAYMALRRRRRQRQREDRQAEEARRAPSPPTVARSDWRDWLPRQPRCDLLLTDPPYSTDVINVRRFAAGWLPAALGRVKPTGRAYVFVGAYPEELSAYLSVRHERMPLQQVLVWTYRNRIGPKPTHDYKLNWQAVLYYRGPEAPPLACETLLEQFTVQDVSAPDGRQGNCYHPWQKPDELAERLVRHSTGEGHLVLDPFAGTGTFVLAAARLGRKGMGCEISEEMLSLARRRGCVDAQ